MRDLQTIAKECMNELDNLGIVYGNIVTFEVNTRAKKRWGQCKKVHNGYIINISIRLLDENVPIKSLKETILHEMLHTCENCFDHKETWKAYAYIVNKAYGYNIKRCTSASEKGIKEKTEIKHIKHKFICEKCGQVINRERESNFTRNYTRYACGICRGKFKKVF